MPGGRKPDGEGRTSRNWRPTHPFKAGGIYWRTEEDYLQWKKEYNARRSARAKEIAAGAPKGPQGPKHPKSAGSGASTNKWRPTHQYKRRGRWWRSEEEYKKFADGQALRKRAIRNEVSIEHQLEIERQTQSAIKATLSRENHLQQEFMRLKAKHGLHPRATRATLKNAYAHTLDPEIKQFFHLESVAMMKADEKLHAIREMFLSGTRPQEILYRTALMVGVAMKEKQ